MPVLALGDVLVALVAVTVILAAVALAWLAAHLVPNLPLIGSALRSAVVSAINGVESSARAWANASAIALAFTIEGTALTIWWACYYLDVALNGAIVGVQEATATAESLYNQAIAHADADFNQAVADAESLYNAAVAHADALYNQALGDITADYDKAVGVAEDLYSSAVQITEDYYNKAVAYAAGLVGPIEADINAVAGTLEGDISGAVASLTQAITSVEAQALSDINSAVAQAETVAAALASAAASGLSSALDATADDVLNPALQVILPALGVLAPAIPAAESIVLGIPGILGETRVAGLSGALAALTAVSAGVLSEVTTCLTPNCDALGGLGNLFSSLEETAVWALIVALIAGAVADPGGAVGDLSGDFSSLVTAAAAPIYALIGLA